MSKVKIQGNASGTGVLTIEAPNTNTDRSLTLPDGAGEILTDASTLSSSNLSGALPAIDGSNLTGIETSFSHALYTRQFSNGVSGGDSVAYGATYGLNTEYSDPDGIGTLSNSRVTLGAGKYYLTYVIDVYQSGELLTKLVTSAGEISRSNNSRPGNADYTTATPVGAAYLEVASSEWVEIQYNCSNARATFGLGVNRSNGTDNEVYGWLSILKVG